MNEREYYLIFFKDNKLHIGVIKRAEYCSVFIGAILGFFYVVDKKIFRCRSPPLINLKFKKNFKLIGGKKDGRTPKKKKI